MAHSFKMRKGVKTCGPCGKTQEDLNKNTQYPGWCSSAECPWKHPDETPEAMQARVQELEARFSYWRF